MRPARPVVCEPLAVMRAGDRLVPSVNSGSCGLPLVSEVAVEVADSELTVLPLPLALSTCSTVPDGLENCRLLPNAALSCATTELMPPEKLTPMVWLLELGGEVCSGSVPPGPSDTIVIVCWTIAGVGVGELHRIARQQRADIDADIRTGARGDRRSARRLVRQRLRHLVGQLVELVLRLRQDGVAHLQIGADLTRLDGAVGDQIGGGAAGRHQRDGAGAVLARIGAPQRGRRQRARHCRKRAARPASRPPAAGRCR